MNNQIQDAKFYLINTLLISFSFTNVETTLKLLSLLLAIGYTIRKWYLLEKNKTNDKD